MNIYIYTCICVCVHVGLFSKYMSNTRTCLKGLLPSCYTGGRCRRSIGFRWKLKYNHKDKSNHPPNQIVDCRYLTKTTPGKLPQLWKITIFILTGNLTISMAIFKSYVSQC